MNDLLELDARASIALPLRWTLARRFTSLPETVLPAGILRWPMRGTPIVEATQLPFRDLAELAEVPIDLMVVEVDRASELEEVAAFASDTGASTLCIVGREVPRATWEVIPYESRSVMIVAHQQYGDDVPSQAGRRMDQLVRERLYLQLLRHWRGALTDYAHLGIAIAGERFSLGPAAPPPWVAPLHTVEHEHVAGVVGLWFKGDGKALPRLDVSRGRLYRTLEAPPPGLVRAIAPLPPLAEARILVVEDDPHVADAMALSLENAATRLRRPLHVERAASAEEAMALVEKEGAPELLWADIHLAGEMSGVDLVRWLRREKLATVVFGKSARRDGEAIARLYRLGAVHVTCGELLSPVTSVLTTGLAIAAEAQGIRQRVVEAALGDGRLGALLGQALAGRAAEERAQEIRDRLAALAADRADQPPQTGDRDTTLDALCAAVATRTKTPDVTVRAAAHALGVDEKTLRERLKEAKEREETTPA